MYKQVSGDGNMAKKMKILKQGDLVVETAGTLSGVSGSTDLVKVGIVSSEDENESLYNKSINKYKNIILLI